MPGEVYFRHIVFDFAQEENVSRLLLLLVCGSEGSQYKDLNDMPYELWPSSCNSWRNCTILSELCVKFTSNLTYFPSEVEAPQSQKQANIIAKLSISLNKDRWDIERDM